MADSGRPPNLILVLFDSMRARNLSCYGYQRSTTPNLDRLAAQGVRFANAYVQAPFTTASIASILTSVYPSTHRLEHYGQRLSGELVTLAEALRGTAYHTAAFVANPHVDPDSDLTRGFEYFTDGRPWHKRSRFMAPFVAWAESGHALNRSIRQHLAGIGDQPFFFFIFYIEPHVPFSGLPRILLPLVGRKFHTPDFETLPYTDRDLSRIVDMYDRSLRRADRYLGQLVSTVQRASQASDTIFLISADHGEGLDRRTERAGHGRLYENGIHVPLVAWSPEIAKDMVVEDLATSLDLAPTICELAGVAIPDQFEGDSLVPYLRGEPLLSSRSRVISEYHDSRSIRTEQWKLVQRGPGIGAGATVPADAVELYNLHRDPEEEENLATEHPDIVDELAARLDQFVRGHVHPTPAPSEFVEDGQVRERLRGLGYLD